MYREYRLWTLIRQTVHLLGKYREQELREFGMTIMASGVLNILKTANEPPNIAEISRIILREPHTVGTSMKRMETKGLIKIIRDRKRKAQGTLESINEENS